MLSATFVPALATFQRPGELPTPWPGPSCSNSVRTALAPHPTPNPPNLCYVGNVLRMHRTTDCWLVLPNDQSMNAIIHSPLSDQDLMFKQKSIVISNNNCWKTLISMVMAVLMMLMDTYIYTHTYANHLYPFIIIIDQSTAPYWSILMIAKHHHFQSLLLPSLYHMLTLSDDQPLKYRRVSN